MEQRRLYRLEEGKMICGVCAGIAEYLNMDVTIIRLIALLIVLWGGSGLIFYIIAAIVMPVKPY
ncbi:MAG: PspC domain-containing protein [Eubacteriales bacterium]|nr:PspC domain-containing protein [Eubacteriales bacterium]